MQTIDFRPNGSADVTIQNQSGGNGKQSQEGVAAQFMELLGKARADIQEGLGMTATRSTVVTMPERTEADVQRDDRQPEAQDQGRDRAEARDNDGDRGEDRREAPRADNHDDRGRDATSDRKDDHAEARSDQHSGDQAQHKGDDGRRADDANQQADSGKSEAADTGNRAEAADTATSGNDGAQTAATGEAAQATTAEAAAGAMETLVTGPQEDPALVAVAAAAANTQAQTHKADTGAQQATGPAQQAEIKVEGPARTDGHIGQQWQSTAGEAARAGIHNQAQKGQDQAQANAAQQAQAALEGKADPATNAQRQAAQLSKMVGEGNRISVQTQVTEESATLVSKPTNTLSNTSILAGDGTKQGQAQNQQNNPMAAMHANAQQAAAQQAAAGPAQAQNQQAAAQAAQQVAQTAGAEAKGPIQANVNAGAGAQNAAAGGEAQGTTNGPGNTSSTNQAQQSQQAQAANQPKFTLPGQSVVDQVNVQITKALQNGMDKINIQLKPANLGRVEVALEMSADGRVSAVVSADNKDTLNLLQKDSSELAKALQNAGLELEGNGLQFSLREQQGDGAEGGTGYAGGTEGIEDDFAESGFDDGDDFDADSLPEYAGGSGDGRLDIRA